jgi:hypothetical protein
MATLIMHVVLEAPARAFAVALGGTQFRTVDFQVGSELSAFALPVGLAVAQSFVTSRKHLLTFANIFFGGFLHVAFVRV